jgi:hypothetical protein
MPLWKTLPEKFIPTLGLLVLAVSTAVAQSPDKLL